MKSKKQKEYAKYLKTNHWNEIIINRIYNAYTIIK